MESPDKTIELRSGIVALILGPVYATKDILKTFSINFASCPRVNCSFSGKVINIFKS